MSKITKFYLNTAKYIAEDEDGNQIDLDVNYWGKSFALSQKNEELEVYAAKLLQKKHRVNFVAHMKEE